MTRTLIRSRSLGRDLSRLIAAAALASTPAFALQPLAEFVTSARTYSPDNAIADATVEAQKAAAGMSLGRILPGVSARGIYTRNQFQVGPLGPIPGLLPEAVYLQRYNQLDGFFNLNVPLVDLAAFVRLAAANVAADSAEAQARATALQVEATVTQDYYQLVETEAVVTAAQKALAVSKASLARTQSWFDEGRVAGLELDRAKADVEAQTQQLTGAQLRMTFAAIALRSASGLEPQLDQPIALVDDLHPEPGIDNFEAADASIPTLVAAARGTESAQKQATASKLQLIPSLTGSVSEHGTNASSFTGQPWSYAATVTLNWQLDYTSFATIRAQEAGAAIARAREQSTRTFVRDTIRRSWEAVNEAIVRSRSARAQQQASRHAAELAQDRYEAGSTTQLDLLTAQQAAFGADVARIQADADVANARLQLRLAAGLDPFSPKGNP